MKKLTVFLLVVVICLGLVACGAETSSIQNTAAPKEEFPLLGKWKAEGSESYITINEDGTIEGETISTSTTTTTINGVSSTKTSKSSVKMNSTWSVEGGNFMYAKKTPYEMVFDGTHYKLVGPKTTYVKVDSNEETQDETSVSKEPVPYTIGAPITADGIEMSFSEVGFYEDIRITSKDSGIKITSGPSPDSAKQFCCLKGTLKNTGKEAVLPSFAGKAVLDGYEYDIRAEITNEDATPVSRIDPLDSVIVQIYAMIPNELVSNFQNGQIYFTFNDNFDMVINNEGTYLYSAEIHK